MKRRILAAWTESRRQEADFYHHHRQRRKRNVFDVVAGAVAAGEKKNAFDVASGNIWSVVDWMMMRRRFV